MIQIKCGTCGTSQGYKNKADGPLTLPAAEERRLVARGVADYATKPIIGTDTGVAPRENVSASAEPESDRFSDENIDSLDDGEVAKLERLQKVDLEQMAADMGVDISGAKNKHDLAVLIAAAEGQDDGEVPPVLTAGGILK